MRLARVRERLFEPVDISWLVLFRIGFGALMVWHVATYLAAGRVRRYWIEPEVRFGFPGFEWLEPWPGAGMVVHFYALGALAVLMAVGLLYRLSAALFFLGFAYVFLLEQGRYQNHTYLITLLAFLAILLPANRSFSVDARLFPSIPSSTVPAWTLWLVRFQVGVPYFFGGLAKLNGDWLRGEPLREWLPREPDFPLLGRWFEEEWMVYAFSYGGLLLDLLAVPLLLWRRTRAVTFVVLVLFHLTNARLFHIGVFPWMMIALTTVFLEPDWPRRLASRLRSRSAGAVRVVPEMASVSPKRQKLILGALGAWGLVQVFVPLRHFAIPGKVAWTTEGQRYSWHMKLNDTDGRVLFHVVDPATGMREEVDPRETLERWQAARIESRPYMMRQYARHLAAEAERAGHAGAEVYADARLSLNNRPHQLLVDPEADLSRAPLPGALRSAEWIVPLVVGGR